MPVLDIFKGDAFSIFEMTKAISIIPNNYGLIRTLGLFNEKGIKTTSVLIEKKHGVLNLLPQTERGGEGTYNMSSKRDIVSLNIPNFTLRDRIKAEDVQDIRSFGTESEFETVQNVVLEKLEEMKRKHEITKEFMLSGALQGVVKDGNGDTIVDLYTSFDVSKKTQDFKLGTQNSDIPKYLRDIKRHIETKLQGETMTGILCLCSSEFFDKLISHPSVKDAYLGFQDKTPYRDDQREDFRFQGIGFREYNGNASDLKGNLHAFIPAGKAIFIPLGTQNTFEMVYAPADYIETVNTRGLPLYAKQEVMKYGKGIEIETQANPLPLCKRPEILVEGYSSN